MLLQPCSCPGMINWTGLSFFMWHNGLIESECVCRFSFQEKEEKILMMYLMVYRSIWSMVVACSELPNEKQ